MNESVMVFVDGENLLHRYEAMLRDGRQAQSHVAHEPGSYVWTAQITSVGNLQIKRVAYYTNQVGGDDKLNELEAKLVNLIWRPNSGFSGHVNPRVFKKSSKSHKAASVDINITIDVLRHCHQKDVGAVYIISGDGDYLPLVNEAMRTGTRVFVGALSSGLHPKLRIAADYFIPLDDTFFL
jgi:uncharacterized LabA/DUF88 family protein